MTGGQAACTSPYRTRANCCRPQPLHGLSPHLGHCICPTHCHTASKPIDLLNEHLQVCFALGDRETGYSRCSFASSNRSKCFFCAMRYHHASFFPPALVRCYYLRSFWPRLHGCFQREALPLNSVTVPVVLRRVYGYVSDALLFRQPAQLKFFSDKSHTGTMGHCHCDHQPTGSR
jgi:hypothetical protein